MKLKKPFFMLNTKSYLYGEKLYELAEYADKLAEKTNINLFFTVPVAEIYRVSNLTKSIIVTAQHMDCLKPGRGMGSILPESIISAGAKAVVLNHAEKSISFEDLKATINRAHELKLITIVCANSLEESSKIAKLNPAIILCEPTELIGTGKTSSLQYIKDSNQAVKSTNSNVLVMQGAGISSADDVKRNLINGADGNGVTSGVIASAEPYKTLELMIEETAKFL